MHARAAAGGEPLGVQGRAAGEHRPQDAQARVGGAAPGRPREPRLVHLGHVAGERRPPRGRGRLGPRHRMPRRGPGVDEQRRVARLEAAQQRRDALEPAAGDERAGGDRDAGRAPVEPARPRRPGRAPRARLLPIARTARPARACRRGTRRAAARPPRAAATRCPAGRTGTPARARGPRPRARGSARRGRARRARTAGPARRAGGGSTRRRCGTAAGVRCGATARRRSSPATGAGGRRCWA